MCDEKVFSTREKAEEYLKMKYEEVKSNALALDSKLIRDDYMDGSIFTIIDCNGYLYEAQVSDGIEIDSTITPPKKETPTNTFVVSLSWVVSKDFDVEASTREEAEKIITDRLNDGEFSCWDNGFEATDDTDVSCIGFRDNDDNVVEFDEVETDKE